MNFSRVSGVSNVVICASYCGVMDPLGKLQTAEVIRPANRSEGMIDIDLKNDALTLILSTRTLAEIAEIHTSYQ